MNESSRAEVPPGPIAGEINSPEEFRRIANESHAFLQGGKGEDALQLARRAETFASQATLPPSLETAIALNFLGKVFHETGYTKSARRTYQRSLAIVEELTPRDDSLFATLQNNLGQAEERLGNLAQAKSHLETAVTLKERLEPNSLSLGCSIDNLGTIVNELGDLTKAEELHRRAFLTFERARGPINSYVAVALGNLSNVYHQRKDLATAAAFRLRALDTHQREEGLNAGSTLLDIACLADIYRDQGDEARTQECVNLLLSIGSEKPRPTDRNLAECLRRMAKRALSEARLDLAERLGTRALQLLEALEGPNAPETLRVVHLLGNVQREVGHLDPAEKNYRRALAGYERNTIEDMVIEVTIDLAKLYRDIRAYPLAAKMFEDVLQKLGPATAENRQRRASVLGNLALVSYEIEQPQRAEELLDQALKELPESERHGERPWLLFNQGMIKYHLGQYDEARELYEEAKRLWTEVGEADHPFVATAAADLASVHWSCGDVDQALASFAEAEALRDREMQRILALGSETKRATYAKRLQADLYEAISFCLGAGASRTDVARFAAQMLLRRKGRVMDSLAQNLADARDHLKPEDEISFNRLRTVRTEIAAVITPALVSRRPPEEREKLARLRDEEERLEAALSFRGALHRSGLENISLEDVQQALPADGALIEFVRFSVFDPVRTGAGPAWRGERYAAVLLRHEGDPRWIDLGQASVIDAHVDKWRSSLRNRSFDAQQRDAQAEALFGLLLKSSKSGLADVRHLLIAPDGKLALIPFGCLCDSGGPALNEQFVVSYVTCGREVIRGLATGQRGEDVIVIAAPDFDAAVVESGSAFAAAQFTDRGSFGPLPGTKAEGEEVAALFEDATVFMGKDATVDALRNVRRPIILHIATHGIFVPMEDEVTRRTETLSVGNEFFFLQRAATSSLAHPMFFSGLILAGANRRGSEAASGILTAQEIAGLDLRGTELVVLSACETGLGTVKKGEEFTGLRRALAVAGAATHVTSLWKVDDEATRFLMEHFYRQLLEGRGRAEALQLAQQRIANDPTHPEWNTPFYWAAFVLSGSWTPIDGLKRKTASQPTKTL